MFFQFLWHCQGDNSHRGCTMEAKKLTCTIASSQIVCSIEPSGKAPLETGELTNHRCTSQINSKTALPPVEPVGKSQQFHWLHLHCKMTTLWFCSLLRFLCWRKHWVLNYENELDVVLLFRCRLLCQICDEFGSINAPCCNGVDTQCSGTSGSTHIDKRETYQLRCQGRLDTDRMRIWWNLLVTEVSQEKSKNIFSIKKNLQGHSFLVFHWRMLSSSDTMDVLAAMLTSSGAAIVVLSCTQFIS